MIVTNRVSNLFVASITFRKDRKRTIAKPAEKEQSWWKEVDEVLVAATTGVANWNIENLMMRIFVTYDAFIEVDSAPVHTNHLRFKRNLGGFWTRGQGTGRVYCHPAIEKWLYCCQELAAATRRNLYTEWLDLITEEGMDQYSKRWDMANRFKAVNPLDDVVEMLKKKNIVAIAKCDFDSTSLVRGRGLEFVCASPEKRWLLEKTKNRATQCDKETNRATHCVKEAETDKETKKWNFTINCNRSSSSEPSFSFSSSFSSCELEQSELVSGATGTDFDFLDAGCVQIRNQLWDKSLRNHDGTICFGKRLHVAA